MRNRYVNPRNTTILLFIIFHLSALVFWNIYWGYGWNSSPSEKVQQSFRVFSYYAYPTGLWQNWNVFAPPPQAESLVLIEGKSGNFTASYTPPYQISQERFSHEKERKWHENMLKEEFSNFRGAYLEHWCREFEKEHDRDFTEATLYYRERSIPWLEDGERSETFIRKWVVEC